MKSFIPDKQSINSAVKAPGKITNNPLQRKGAGEEKDALQRKQNPLQRMVDKEDELLEKKDNPLQLKKSSQNPLQFKQPANNPLQLQTAPKAKNNTGLPDSLKAGVENLSGYSLDDVKVHYNSDKPAQLQAHAYAQGTDIHIAPGQEQHLPHEAWHVVQQKQGRVQPTMQLKGGMPVNDDAGLESEADKMGHNASSYTSSLALTSGNIQRVAKTVSLATIQRKSEVNYKTQKVSYTDMHGKSHDEEVGYQADAFIDVTDPIIGAEPDSKTQQKAMYDTLATMHGINYLIRGHLLNGNIGGVGAVYNLFPITSHANSQHKMTAEGHLKHHVRAEQQAFKNKSAGPFFVRYRVTAEAENSSDLSSNASAKFFCEMVSAHSSLPGGKNEVWTVFSQPNNKVQADGDKSSHYDYSNKDLGGFESSGKGESMETFTSRVRSNVNGWKGNKDNEFTPGAKGADVTAHVELSAIKERLLVNLENEIDKHPLCEDLFFIAPEKLKELFANTYNLTDVNQAYNYIWDQVLIYEKGQEAQLNNNKQALLNDLVQYLEGVSISKDAKFNTYTIIEQHVKTIATNDLLEQSISEIVNSVNMEIHKYLQH
ncbi:eCIS core domain-containing protein [Mucilaginibacter robiniae]|uniref:eCIS core domain-containing protein n=1 Tax=Mucilaginibacter robiniae TaxID=2728022 RepID=UPI001B7D0A36|nr:DUF4157 domain-containing protein [Mucilaginibacter robiniae]